MKKNKFLTTICMLSTFIGTNLHAKTAKGKKTVKAKTSHKPLNSKKIIVIIVGFMEFLQTIKVLLLKQKWQN